MRRIGCIGPSPTYAKVKSCVIAKYAQLGKRCKVELASAGYSGPSNVPRSSTSASTSTKAAFFKFSLSNSADAARAQAALAVAGRTDSER